MARRKNSKMTPHKDYSGWRLSHANTEVIDGKKETIVKSWPDIDGIMDDIRKQPMPKRKGTR